MNCSFRRAWKTGATMTDSSAMTDRTPSAIKVSGTE